MFMGVVFLDVKTNTYLIVNGSMAAVMVCCYVPV